MDVKAEIQLADDVITSAGFSNPFNVPLPGPVLQSMQDGTAFSPTDYAHPEEVHPRTPDSDDVNHQPPQQQQQPQQPAARVPIPPQSQPSQPAPASGPMSSSVVIPPRPRPGRKPIPQEHAADRRRLQNRIAQRNFRDKRQQKLVETQLELEDRRQEYQDQVSELQRQLDEVRRETKAQAARIKEQTVEIQQLKKESRERDATLKAERQRAEDAEKKLQQSQLYSNQASTGYAQSSMQNAAAPPPFLAVNTSLGGHMGRYGGPNAYTPPEDSYYHHETDFTSYSNNSRQPQSGNQLRQTISNDTPMDFTRGIGMETDDLCGFCTDDQNCACRNQARQTNVQEASVNSDACATVAPGTCAACQADPEQAAACRDLARGASFSTAPRPSTSDGPRLYQNNGLGGTSISMGPPHPHGGPRVSCAALVADFRRFGERTSSVSELFGGQMMQAYPVAGGGYEFGNEEAAQVLAGLSRRNTMVAESQGPN